MLEGKWEENWKEKWEWEGQWKIIFGNSAESQKSTNVMKTFRRIIRGKSTLYTDAFPQGNLRKVRIVISIFLK
jgi:hypothetical protein